MRGRDEAAIRDSSAFPFVERHAGSASSRTRARRIRCPLRQDSWAPETL